MENNGGFRQRRDRERGGDRSMEDHRRREEQKAMEEFKMMDRDRDGRVSLKEMMNSPMAK
jgi:hypothetical protein